MKKQKTNSLKQSLASMGSVLIAYSGGVDSTFLLKVAKDVLGDNVLAVTAVSDTYPIYELEEAKRIAKMLEVKHIIIETDELAIGNFAENSSQRCYWCKQELFQQLNRIAQKCLLSNVLDGTVSDDIDDYRPGRKAAVELGVKSPLKESGFLKKEIRELSREFGLPTWDKPTCACLASRFPYGVKITRDKLAMVDNAECFLRVLGIKQVRVRHHDTIARIEVEKKDISVILAEKTRDEIVSFFKELGYSYITVDLQGYRTGSLNEVLRVNDREM
ncbi:MAG: ATP-dependent sacrificial sulfur transferase LarE [Candidatus Omnitrophota bacterium]